jgi:hypothetical protein
VSEVAEIPPNFKSLRETPKAGEGKQTPQSLATFIDQVVYRSPDGQVRGLKSAYSKSGGTFTTAQGDEFSVLEDGKPGDVIINKAKVEIHEAVPVPIETITLQDGSTVEVSTQPISQLFEGKPQSGHPLFVQGSNSLESGVVVPHLAENTVTNSVTVGGIRTDSSTSTITLELHNPFIEPLPPKTLEQSFEERVNSFLTGVPIIETPDPTLVKSMTPEEYKQDKTLRLITKITPNL